MSNRHTGCKLLHQHDTKSLKDAWSAHLLVYFNQQVIPDFSNDATRDMTNICGCGCDYMTRISNHLTSLQTHAYTVKYRITYLSMHLREQHALYQSLMIHLKSCCKCRQCNTNHMLDGALMSCVRAKVMNTRLAIDQAVCEN